jgi:hypothetical protein
LEVSRAFLGLVDVVETGSAALVTTVADAGDRAFLVPFVDVLLSSGGGEGDESSDVFSAILPLDNAVYVVALLASELSEVVAAYEKMSGAQASPEPSRLAAMKTYLSHASASLKTLSDGLERLSPSEGAPA